MTKLPRALSLLTRAAGLAAALHAPPAALAQATINGCSAQALAACGYASPNNFTPAVVDAYLEDPSRGNHPVPIRVRYPLGASGALPVVIWGHGGGTTNVDAQATAAAGFTVTRGQQSSVRRSESFARAGYVVIHIGRMEPRSLTAAQLQDCLTAGVIVGGIASPSESALSACRTWTGFHLYGPRNVAFVAALLAGYQRGMLPGFDGTLDRERIVVGGWSGGSEAPLNIAGAYQRWSGTGAVGGAAVVQPPVVVPGVVAFFTDSPRGPASAGFSSGFQEDSFYGIDSRPMLMNTARDDRGGDPAPPVSRNANFFGAAKGGKLMSYSWTPSSPGGPNHGTMNINDSIDEATGEPATGCNTALREAHCAALEQLGIAFLDAHVLGRAAAQQWLASGNFKVLTSDRIELYGR